MKIVDARSGREGLKPGDVVVYPGGEWWELVAVEDHLLLSATAIVRDHTTGGGGSPKRVPLVVRLLHPRFLFQRVGFFPS